MIFFYLPKDAEPFTNKNNVGVEGLYVLGANITQLCLLYKHMVAPLAFWLKIVLDSEIEL